MKITTVLLLSACLAASAKVHSQITLSEKDTPLQTIFEKIENQSDYTFAYAINQLAIAKKVSIQIVNGTIEQVLKICFANQPFSYTVIDKIIALKVKDNSEQNILKVFTPPPPINIKGKVVNENREPVEGVSVKVKGTNTGTTTNASGEFSLTGIDENATLIFTGTNIETFETKVKGKNEFHLTAKTKVAGLQEVIVNKGYYTEKQKTSVSNAVTITAKDIERQPVQNVVLALQARVPGLFVTQGSGNAGGNLKVRIQGENSMQNGNDPLYVVDGVPIDAQLPSTGIDGPLGNVSPLGGAAGAFNGTGNPLNYLNPLDIESVEILKDADATAIYGSRAANGAILITTKKGKAGEMKFDLNMETGWGKMVNRVDMMNTRQYLDMRYEAFANDGIDWRKPNVSAIDLKLWDTTRYTNWQDELLGGTAKYNNINASLSGGSATMRYLVSGTYHKETTIWPLPSDFADQKAALHFNINGNNTSQKLRMQLSGNYMFDDNQLPAMDMTRTALVMEPNAPPLLNADGSINWATDANGNSTLDDQANVMAQKYKKYINKTHNLVSSLRLDYTILPGLNIGSSFGYNYMQSNDFSPSPLIAVTPEQRPSAQRTAAFGDRNIQSWIIEPQASYRINISKGTLDLLVGSTFQNQSSKSGYIVATGQLSDELLDNINSASTIRNGLSTVSNYRYNAFFGRASYNWQDKYIFSMNARRDGSSRFGADSRFHNFGSAGAAWLFSNEDFFKSRFDFISFGKIRGSYGTTGNDQIGDYRFMSLYDFLQASAPYQGTIGLLPKDLPNSELGWEETKKLQLGIDLGFLQDKLVVNANYVQNRSSNQLLNRPLPSPAGFTNYLVNFPATVQNKAWEFMITGKIIQKKNFAWTSSANLTIPKNALLEYPGISDSSFYWRRIGQPIDVNFYYRWLGVAAGTGDYLYADNNRHPILSPSAKDQKVSISRYPKFYGGLQNSISYKGFQLDFIFQFVKQTGYNDVAFFNGSFGRYPGTFRAGFSNQPVTLLDRWQKPGDNVSVAKYSTNQIQYIDASDRRFTDVTYVSLKNVSLSWDLPQEWMEKAHFRTFRLYTHVQNLLTLSNYKGLNPETQSMVALPPLQVWTVGVRVGL